MSGVPSITASGLGLLERADRRLARSADAFTRSGAPSDRGVATTDPGAVATADGDKTADVVDAAVGVIYGRTAFQLGVTLIEAGRDTEKTLLDVLA